MIAALLVALLLVLAPPLSTSAGAQTGTPQSAAPAPAPDPAARSEAAEAWDAIKYTTNQALLEAFITRYGNTFFAEIAKVRLKELKANPSRPAAVQAFPDVPQNPVQAEPASPEEPITTDGIHQRSVLYEEDLNNPSGRQLVGTAVWHAETIKADGKPDELAIRGDLEIPARSLRMTITIRRNTDTALPASHTIELASHVPADSDFRIASIPGMLMKSNEKARGRPFAGLAVKVTDGFFMVGLSNVSVDRASNLNLLVERGWFDIPMVYANNRRAILAIAKGETGDEAIKTVLTAWGQYPTVAPAGTASAPNQ